MSRFEFGLAEPGDDAAIRQRLAEDHMPGGISISFRREPSYFASLPVIGDPGQVIVCRDSARARLVGLGARYGKTVYAGGLPVKATYLADLRCAPEYRRGTLLARGYRYLAGLEAAQPSPLCFTLIYEENLHARTTLTAGRAGLPAYHDLGRLLTPAIFLDLPKRDLPPAGLRFKAAVQNDIELILSFLNRTLRTRPLAPVYDRHLLDRWQAAGFKVADILLAFSGDELVGTFATWDQDCIRQTHVEDYSPGWRLARRLYNPLTRMLPLRPLPAAGDKVRSLYACLVAIKNNDINIFRVMMRRTYRSRRTGPWSYLIVGLHERDPLVRGLSGYRQMPAAGRLYEVVFPNTDSQAPARQQLIDPDGIPYPEVASL